MSVLVPYPQTQDKMKESKKKKKEETKRNEKGLLQLGFISFPNKRIPPATWGAKGAFRPTVAGLMQKTESKGNSLYFILYWYPTQGRLNSYTFDFVCCANKSIKDLFIKVKEKRI